MQIRMLSEKRRSGSVTVRVGMSVFPRLQQTRDLGEPGRDPGTLEG